MRATVVRVWHAPAALLLLAASASAQSSRPSAAEMAKLRADWIRGRDSALAARTARTVTRVDSLRRELTDTVRVAGVVALVRPDLHAIADSGLRRAAAVIARRYGDSLNTALGTGTVLIGTPSRSEHDDVMGRPTGTVGVGFGAIDNARTPALARVDGAPVAGIEAATLRSAASAYHARSDATLRRWVATAVPTFDFATRDLSDDRAALLSAGAEARRCLGGAFERCAAVVFDTSAANVQVRGAVRASLLQFALERGGPDAWKRLTADSTAPLESRVIAATGLPLDSIVPRWARLVADSREDVTPGDLLSVFGLMAAALLVSRRRSP
jgi:hypothetical protein